MKKKKVSKKKAPRPLLRSWVCQKCGVVNSPYITTCPCEVNGTLAKLSQAVSGVKSREQIARFIQDLEASRRSVDRVMFPAFWQDVQSRIDALQWVLRGDK